MRKKILHVSCEGLGNGGIQNVLMGIVRNLKSDYDFDVLLFTDEKRHYDEEFEEYGSIFRIPNYNGKSYLLSRSDYYLRFFRILLGTYKILKKNGPYDVIHCHNYFESGICVMAAKLANVPVRITHSHNTALPGEKFNIIRQQYDAYLQKLIRKNSTDLIGCSKIACEYLFGIVGKFRVINNAIDLKKFNNKNFDGLRTTDSLTFINIGRWSIQKNQIFLISIFKHIHDSLPNTNLKIIGFGDESYEQKIIKLINSYRLERCVEILPGDSDIPLELAKSNYMIFPSTYEGFGIVLLEAQAMGVKPFVSNAVPPEADAGLCTYLSLNDGPKIWAKNILSEIKETRLEEHYMNMNKYDITEVCKEYYKIYNGDGK